MAHDAFWSKAHLIDLKSDGYIRHRSRGIEINGKYYLVENRSESGPGYVGQDHLTITDSSSGGTSVASAVGYMAVYVGGAQVYENVNGKITGDGSLAENIVGEMVKDFTAYKSQMRPLEALENTARGLHAGVKGWIDGNLAA